MTYLIEKQPGVGVVETEGQKNIRALASYIRRALYYRFNMDSAYAVSCGTPGCIAGFACALWPEVVMKFTSSWDTRLLAAKLGLDNAQFTALVYQYGGSGKPISRKQAINILLHLAETGEVKWDHEKEPTQ